jgi:hypothetical protein
MISKKKKNDNYVTNKKQNLKENNAMKEKSTKLINDPSELTPFRKWYIKQFKENYINMDDDKLKKYFDNSKNDVNLLYGSYNRLHAFITFGYVVEFDIVDTISMNFKLRDMDKDIETIFSFGYFNHNITKKTQNRELNLLHTNCTMSYFVLGGSFISKDGEYRSSCISSRNYKYIGTSHLQPILSDIMEYIRSKISDRRWLISKEYFYPTDSKKFLETTLEYYLHILQYEILSLVWFNLMYNVKLKLIENHINDKFTKIMLEHKDEDLEFFNILIKRHGNENIELFRTLLNNIKLDTVHSPNIDSTKIGQKIIPLSVSEVQHPFNIRYKPWREYIISVYLSKMVINYVSPGFFITNSWFYIKNSRKGLFDNDIQYEKMQRSELATQITQLLIRANLFTQENITQKKKLLKKNKKMVNSIISEKFKTLSKKINDPINYAKEEIIMSNVALCFMTEYVGRTMMDVITLCKSSTFYNKLIGSPFSFNGSVYFKKYMFDMCYNLYCMNYRAGIIHGDLHLNNATLKPMLYKNFRDINVISNPCVLYTMKNNQKKYIIPTTSYNMCVIDFSRSIVLPNKICDMEDDSIPKSYSIITHKKEFQEEQIERLLYLYLSYTTDSDNNKDSLRIIFRSKFEAVFKLMTATDIYGFTKKLLSVFNINDSTIVEPHKNCIDILQKINKTAYYFITVEMNKLIMNPLYEDIVNNMDWPLCTIIEKCFYEFSIDNTKLGNIIDVFNMDNDLKYSLNMLKNYPPIIKSSKVIVDGKEINTNKITRLNVRRKMFEKERMKKMKTIAFIANRQKEKHF